MSWFHLTFSTIPTKILMKVLAQKAAVLRFSAVQQVFTIFFFHFKLKILLTSTHICTTYIKQKYLYVHMQELLPIAAVFPKSMSELSVLSREPIKYIYIIICLIPTRINAEIDVEVLDSELVKFDGNLFGDRDQVYFNPLLKISQSKRIYMFFENFL